MEESTPGQVISHSHRTNNSHTQSHTVAKMSIFILKILWFLVHLKEIWLTKFLYNTPSCQTTRKDFNLVKLCRNVDKSVELFLKHICIFITCAGLHLVTGSYTQTHTGFCQSRPRSRLLLCQNCAAWQLKACHYCPHKYKHKSACLQHNCHVSCSKFALCFGPNSTDCIKGEVCISWVFGTSLRKTPMYNKTDVCGLILNTPCFFCNCKETFSDI